MGKVLCYIYDRMADFEMTLATTVIGLWLEKELVTVAYDKKVITSQPGVKYQPHITVKEALELDDVEGIIIPGGWNDELRPELKELITKLNNEKKLLAAICAGPQYLARSGVLENRRYTTTLTEQYMKEQGKDDPFPREGFITDLVVRDENVITAVGRAFVDFAIEIADWYKMFDNPKVNVTKEELSKSYKGL